MTIKETAGKALLYFYQLQRTDPLSMPLRQLAFISRKTGGVVFTSDKKAFAKDILELNPSSTDFYNAFSFLVSKGFIETEERANPTTRVYVGALVTAKGIDVVEGVEASADGKRKFEDTFAIRAESTVDALVRTQLKSLIG